MTLNEFTKDLGVPLFGKPLGEPINCGGGMSLSGNSEDSYILILGDVSSKAFRKFLVELTQTGRKQTFHRELCGNIFAEFQNSDKTIYTYFTAEAKTARIIFDNASTPLAEAWDYSPDIRENTALMQFSLHYARRIDGRSSNRGMLYTLRLRNNSIVIIDGGVLMQATEEACDEYMERIRELTDTKKGEKIRVSAYICTHKHRDHMDFFTKLLKREKDTLEVERVFYNFPSESVRTHGTAAENLAYDYLRQRLHEYAPNAKYFKPHTGQAFRLGDARIEFLATHEDILPRSPAATGENPYRGFNETSTVFRILFDNSSAIFLGDAEESNGDILLQLYGKNYLSCHYLQVAHHMVNANRNIYENIRAKKLLIPQGQFTAQSRDHENRHYFINRYGAENLFYAGDCTYVFTVSKNRGERIDCYEHKGYFYDNSGY